MTATLIGPNLDSAVIGNNFVLFRRSSVLVGPPVSAGNVTGWKRTFFLELGKLAWTYDTVGSNANEYKKLIASTMLQMAVALGNEAIKYSDVMLPLFNNVKAAIDATELVRGILRRAARDMAVVTLIEILELPAKSTANVCFAALVDRMEDDGDSIESDGLFQAFFDFLGVDLPTSGSPNVPDSWVTSQVL